MLLFSALRNQHENFDLLHGALKLEDFVSDLNVPILFVVINLEVRAGPGTPEQKTTFQTSLDEETVMRDLCAPQKARNSYQLFLKMECQRLRKIHGDASGSRSIRDMAIDAWRHLSEDDRLV